MTGASLMKPTRAAPTGPAKGQAGKLERGVGPQHGGNVRFHFGVERQHGADNLNLVIEKFGKQGADGAVDEPAGEDFLFRGAPFAAEERAGDFSGGVEFFLKVHRQGEKRGVRHRIPAGGDVGHHNGVFHVDEDGGVGLTSDFAGFQGHLASAEVKRFGGGGGGAHHNGGCLFFQCGKSAVAFQRAAA